VGLFRADGTGTRSNGGDFRWHRTDCRSLFLEPTEGGGTAAALTELGGKVEVGRFTFVLDGERSLCGLGTPPPD